MRRKLIVLGIDGATFDVIEPMVEAGRLPNFARLMRDGSHGRLRSTIHPLTPQAWATFVTGTNPGKHGIFDFGYRRDGSYELDLASSRTRRRPGFWEALNASGLTFGSLNIPLSYPPERVNGFSVTGMHTPAIDKGTYPADLHAELMAAVPDYRIDVMCHWYEDYEPFLDDVSAMMDARQKAALWLYDRFAPDVFCPVFVGVDRVQHALWGRFENGEGESRTLSGAVARAYMQADEIVGEWICKAGGEANILIMSDHGFGDLKKDVYLNRFLADAGYLRFDPGKVRTYRPPEPPDTGDPRHAWHHRLRVNGGSLPDDDEAVAAGRMPARYRAFDTIDWSRTVAYAHGLFGNVYINVHGREPEGVVPRGREYRQVRERVARDLETLFDPEDGKPICDRVWRREELYSGPAFDLAPDLVLTMRGYSYMTRGACEFFGDTIVSDPVINHTGNHRLDGILIAAGPDFESGRVVTGASLQDLAPTLCATAGAAPADGWDGQVRNDLYNGGFLALNHIDSTGGGDRPPDNGEGSAYDADETEKIRERLRALGYLG